MQSKLGHFWVNGVLSVTGNGTQLAAVSMLHGFQSMPPDNVIFGKSSEMQLVRKCLAKVCPTDIPILIQGNSGTGKEVLGHWIHAHSLCREGPFVKVSCAAIPGPLLESELFGYEKGAFTGANASKPGRVELANSGSLFLDEITELDTFLQAKLLQVLQDGRFSRLGDEEERRVNVRVICTTNRHIEEAVRSSRFRQDLYYRINVFGVKLLALSDRREDIPLMANYIFEQLVRRFQRDAPPLTPRMLQILQKREWKGNIRELENCIATYVLLGALETPEDGELLGSLGATETHTLTGGAIPLKHIARRACRELSREVILNALQANQFNRSRTAQALKISYRSLLYKIREAALLPKRPHPPVDGSSRAAATPAIPSE
jgi:two-component system, NtrC family, response regulator AtoC